MFISGAKFQKEGLCYYKHVSGASYLLPTATGNHWFQKIFQKFSSIKHFCIGNSHRFKNYFCQVKLKLCISIFY